MIKNKIKYLGMIFAPLKNEDILYPHHKDDGLHKSFFINNEEIADAFVYGEVGQSLNKALNIMIDTYEEEKIVLEDLDKAFDIVSKGIKKEENEELRRVLNELLVLIEFAKEKGTYVAFWL